MQDLRRRKEEGGEIKYLTKPLDEDKGESTFDVIKYSAWMESSRQRRMGLPEQLIQDDCMKIQEKIMFRGSFRTYWP